MATQTYLEKFNFYLSSFLHELTSTFPEFKETIETNYSDIINLHETKESNNSDRYVKSYMTQVKSLHSQIAKKDDTIFKGLNEVHLLNGIDFRDIWSKDINENSRENIWKYLQTLIVIGKKVVGDDEEIGDLLNKFTTGGEDLENQSDEMLDMLKNMSSMTQDPDDNTEETSESDMKNLFEGGIISDIAKELTGELNLENLDIGEPNNMNEAFSNLMKGGNSNFFNIVQKVGEKIQNKVQSGQVNQGDLMKEAQKMMGGLKNPEKMANVMKAKHQQQGGATRDRLKRKLEERKANKL
jgi:hypothetical protein